MREIYINKSKDGGLCFFDLKLKTIPIFGYQPKTKLMSLELRKHFEELIQLSDEEFARLLSLRTK
ncbi:MAG: hypothetical protein BGO86_00815 [Chryseobacterium sp. 36-9]|nr:MAG: hypothetical protein BGO86_00815 [Chryseobacterium sp. 36-9]